MTILRPIPRSVSRPLSLLVLAAWALQMGSLLHRSYLQAASVTLAGDLSRYGSSAQWKGVYYRGEKIGYAVTQTVPAADGYELQEDGQIQMTLLGASTAARMLDPVASPSSTTITTMPATSSGGASSR